MEITYFSVGPLVSFLGLDLKSCKTLLLPKSIELVSLTTRMRRETQTKMRTSYIRRLYRKNKNRTNLINKAKCLFLFR